MNIQEDTFIIEKRQGLFSCYFVGVIGGNPMFLKAPNDAFEMPRQKAALVMSLLEKMGERNMNITTLHKARF
jgi:hypothetical protein